jgi:hypothetical protein
MIACIVHLAELRTIAAQHRKQATRFWLGLSSLDSAGATSATFSTRHASMIAPWRQRGNPPPSIVSELIDRCRRMRHVDCQHGHATGKEPASPSDPGVIQKCG